MKSDPSMGQKMWSPRLLTFGHMEEKEDKGEYGIHWAGILRSPAMFCFPCQQRNLNLGVPTQKKHTPTHKYTHKHFLCVFLCLSSSCTHSDTHTHTQTPDLWDPDDETESPGQRSGLGVWRRQPTCLYHLPSPACGVRGVQGPRNPYSTLCGVVLDCGNMPFQARMQQVGHICRECQQGGAHHFEREIASGLSFVWSTQYRALSASALVRANKKSLVCEVVQNGQTAFWKSQTAFWNTVSRLNAK